MSNQPHVIKNAAAAEIGSLTPASQPLGRVTARSGTAQTRTVEDIGASIGVWESSVGRFRRSVAQREFCHILSGRCVFRADGCDDIELEAGDAVIFPANCQGEWDVREPLRKTYVIF